jgi:hypothetical protein
MTRLAGSLVILWAMSPTVTTSAQIRYPMPGPNPYGYRYGEPESSVQLSVTPKEAAVYVDGYYAGLVDDFDGAFQRLHVTAGAHEIVVYLDGYRSLRQSLFLSPNATRRIRATLERLGPGEPNEPLPVPAGPPERQPAPSGPGQPPRRGAQLPPGRQPPPGRQAPPPDAPTATLGTVSIRVQPAGAEVLIDGERWSGPDGEARLIVQLSEGRHVVELRRSGYRTHTTEVEIRRGETTSVNVSLTRQ